MLYNILEEKKNNEPIKELFSNILKLNIKDLEFDKIIKMDNISDYKFDIAKLKAIIEKDRNIGETKIYAKKIRYDRIKESIFCYWTLIYEEEFKGKENMEMSNIINKVTIDELEVEEEHKKSVYLTIKNNNSGILEYGTEIHFIEFEEYIRKYENGSKSLVKLQNKINSNDDEILLLAVIFTDKIHR